VLADVLEEELQRVGQHLRGVCGPGGVVRRGGVGLVLGVIRALERDGPVAQRRTNLLESRLVEVELERQRLQFRCGNPPALLRVGEEGINCRNVDRCSQRESFRFSRRVRARARA